MRGWATVPGYRTGGPGVNWRRHDGQDARAAGGRAGDARPGADPQRCQKAWGATKRATDALILARTGEEPERTPETGAGLRQLVSLDEAVRGSPPVAPLLQPGRDLSTASASTTASATPSKTLSAGFATRPTTSTTLNASRRRCTIQGPESKPKHPSGTPRLPEGLNVIGGDKVGHVGGLTD